MKQIGLSNKTILLGMLIIPVIEAVVFWCLLRHPPNKELPKSKTQHNKFKKTDIAQTSQDSDGIFQINLSQSQMGNQYFVKEKDVESCSIISTFTTVMDKIKFLPKLTGYMIPLFIIYFSQYFINQGLVSKSKSMAYKTNNTN